MQILICKFKSIVTVQFARRYCDSSCLLVCVCVFLCSLTCVGPNISKTVEDRGLVPMDHQ